MSETLKEFFCIMGIVATGAIFLFALLMILYSLMPEMPDEPNDGYRKELCTYCGRLVSLDAPVDSEGRCYECRKGVDELV